MDYTVFELLEKSAVVMVFCVGAFVLCAHKVFEAFVFFVREVYKLGQECGWWGQEGKKRKKKTP